MPENFIDDSLADCTFDLALTLKKFSIITPADDSSGGAGATTSIPIAAFHAVLMMTDASQFSELRVSLIINYDVPILNLPYLKFRPAYSPHAVEDIPLFVDNATVVMASPAILSNSFSGLQYLLDARRLFENPIATKMTPNNVTHFFRNIGGIGEAVDPCAVGIHSSH
jgi:hypothetical protein